MFAFVVDNDVVALLLVVHVVVVVFVATCSCRVARLRSLPLVRVSFGFRRESVLLRPLVRSQERFAVS